MGDEADDSSPTFLHLGEEGGAGSISDAWLAASPVSRFGLNGAAEQAQHGRGDGMADQTAILAGAHIQAVMGPVLDRPILANQFEQADRGDFFRRQAGDDPVGLHFLAAVVQFADAIDPRHQGDVGKAHLFRRHFPHLDATPLNPSVALLDAQVFRRERLRKEWASLFLEIALITFDDHDEIAASALDDGSGRFDLRVQSIHQDNRGV